MGGLQDIESASFLFAVEGEGFYLFDVLFLVVFVEAEGLLLSWAFDVRLVLEQLLDAEQDLLDCDVRLPVLLLVENRQANSPRGIYIGVR